MSQGAGQMEKTRLEIVAVGVFDALAKLEDGLDVGEARLARITSIRIATKRRRKS
jgi:hypothetical protein